MPVDILTGPRALLTLNGAPLAVVTDWEVTDAISYDPVKVLDSILPLDHEAVDYDASMSASQLRLIRQTVVSEGFFPQKGQSAADFLLNILTQENIAAQLEATDENGGARVIVGRLTGVKLASRRMTVGARGMSAENLTFVAIQFTDESEN